MNDVLILLKNIEKEKSIYSPVATYLLEYKGDFNDLTIASISTSTFSSTATITRLAQKVGLSGFTELKLTLKKELMYESINNEVLSNYKDNVNQTIENTLQQVNYDSLIIASNLIYSSDRIGLFGVGGSKLVLYDFYSKLLRLNLNVINETDLHFQHVVAKNLNDNDVALVVSYSGQTQDTLDLLKILNEKKTKVILLTANEQLSPECDVFLKLAKTENFSRVYSLTSKMSMEVILDFIFIEILQNDPEKFEQIMIHNRIDK